MTRTAIHVDHIARVEGHGNVRVVIEDGIVKTVEMNVVEPARLFESMVRGRRFEEVPYIASRICGICSASHVVTDLLAIERVFGVEPTDRTRALRDLLVYGSYLQNHATHLFVFAAPDFLGMPSVFPLPVSALLFVGRSAARRLEQYGIRTIGELAACRCDMLTDLFGKTGRQLHIYANGLENSPVRPFGEREPVKSVGNGTTFPKNLTRWEEAQTQISILSDNVAWRLRKYGLYCTAVQLTIRDADFRTITRQKQLGHSTHITREIAGACMALLRQSWQMPHPIRMLTVTALNLVDDGQYASQMDLFAPAGGEKNGKLEKLEHAVDHIREKYGSAAISYAAALQRKPRGKEKAAPDRDGAEKNHGL